MPHNSYMKTKTLSVRLEESVAGSLEKIEAATGIDRSQYVRGVIKALVTYFEDKREIRLPFVLMSQAEWDQHRSEVQNLRREIHKLDPDREFNADNEKRGG